MKNIFLRSVALLAVVAWFTSCDHTRNDILLEAESFAATGGWVSDNQSMMQMGSPYLMAHGLGIPVADATTTFKATKGGDYRLWVRTRDWCLPFGKSDSPGRFQVLINGEAAAVVFGTEGADWHWQDGGIITLRTGKRHCAARPDRLQRPVRCHLPDGRHCCHSSNQRPGRTGQATPPTTSPARP